MLLRETPVMPLPPATPHITTPYITTARIRTPHIGTPHIGTPHIRTPHKGTPYKRKPHIGATICVWCRIASVGSAEALVVPFTHILTSLWTTNRGFDVTRA
jgi:hypothetical protein